MMRLDVAGRELCWVHAVAQVDPLRRFSGDLKCKFVLSALSLSIYIHVNNEKIRI